MAWLIERAPAGEITASQDRPHVDGSRLREKPPPVEFDRVFGVTNQLIAPAVCRPTMDAIADVEGISPSSRAPNVNGVRRHSPTLRALTLNTVRLIAPTGVPNRFSLLRMNHHPLSCCD
jgi:hypothetical protein